MPEYFGENRLNLENFDRKLMFFCAVAQFESNYQRQRL